MYFNWVLCKCFEINVVRKYFTLYIWVIFITRFILSFLGKYPGLDFFCSCDINLQLWLLIEVIILFNSIKIVLYYSRYHFKWLWWTCIQLNLEVLFACVLFQGIRVLHLPAWHLFLCNTPSCVWDLSCLYYVFYYDAYYCIGIFVIICMTLYKLT